MMRIVSHLVHEEPDNFELPEIEVSTGQLIVNGRPQPVLQQEDVGGTRGAFHQIAMECQGATHVVSFAMGGILPMLFIATFCDEVDAECHILPGLNWRSSNPTPRERFKDWMQSRTSEDQIVIVDTGRVGNAMGTVLGVLREVSNADIVSAVVVLCESGRYQAPSPSNVAFASDKGIKLQPVEVASNAFEDRLDLMGYDVCRDKEWVKPQAGIRVLRYEEEAGAALVIGPQPGGLLKMLGPSGAMSGALRAATHQ